MLSADGFRLEWFSTKGQGRALTAAGKNNSTGQCNNGERVSKNVFVGEEATCSFRCRGGRSSPRGRSALISGPRCSDNVQFSSLSS